MNMGNGRTNIYLKYAVQRIAGAFLPGLGKQGPSGNPAEGQRREPRVADPTQGASAGREILSINHLNQKREP